MSYKPTQYEEVNKILHSFCTNIKSILKENFLGMYLYGSLALGDFNLLTSDIDAIIATAAEINAEDFLLLQRMHDDFASIPSPWAHRIEFAYVSKDAFNAFNPSSVLYPQLEKDRPLSREPLEVGWPFQCYTLLYHGITIEGPKPDTFIKNLEANSLRHSSLKITEAWQQQSEQDPSWLEWIRIEKEQSFVVLTLCRILYTLNFGIVASKPAAAEWALNVLGKKWAQLISDAVLGQQEKGNTTNEKINHTLSFINYTVSCLKSNAILKDHN